MPAPLAVAVPGILAKGGTLLKALTLGKGALGGKAGMAALKANGLRGAALKGIAGRRMAGQALTNYMGGKPTIGSLGQNFGLDLAFGAMQGAATPGDLGDKLIAGTTSAVGGGLGGIAATTMIPGGMGKFRWLTEIGGGYAGDMAGQAVGDTLLRAKGGGTTPWEKVQAEGDTAYRAQLEREILAKYGIGGYQPTDLFLTENGLA